MSTPRIYKIYADVISRKIYDCLGNELSSLSCPYQFFKEKIQLQLQLLKAAPAQPIVDGNLSKYTNLAGVTIACSASVDNSRSHYDAGALNAGYSGAVTAIAVKTLEAVPRLKSGTLTLINSAGESESVDFTNYTGVNSIYTFTVSATLTYTYIADDVVRNKKINIIKAENADISQAGKDTGLLVVELGGNTQIFDSLGETAADQSLAEISSCFFELQIIESTVLILAVSFPFRCLCLQDDDGVVPPASAGDYYDKTDVDSLFSALPPFASPTAFSCKTAAENTVYAVPSGKLFSPVRGHLNCVSISGAGALGQYRWLADSTPLMTARSIEKTTANQADVDSFGIETFYPAGTIFKLEITSATTGYTAHAAKGILKGDLINA